MTFLLFVPAIGYAGAPLGIKPFDVVTVVGRQMTGALGAAALAFILRFTLLNELHPIIRSAVLIMVYCSAYLLLVVGLFRVKTPIRVALSLIIDFLPARFASLRQ